MTSSEILESAEQQLAAAVKNYVHQLKQASTTKNTSRKIMFAFNKETQEIAAEAEQLFSQQQQGPHLQAYTEKLKQKLIEAMDEMEIHASAGF